MDKRSYNKAIKEAIKKVKLFRKNFVFQDEDNQNMLMISRYDFKRFMKRIEGLKK